MPGESWRGSAFEAVCHREFARARVRENLRPRMDLRQTEHHEGLFREGRSQCTVFQSYGEGPKDRQLEQRISGTPAIIETSPGKP